MHYKLISFLVLCVIFIAVPLNSVGLGQAQGEDRCSALVQTALNSLEACLDLDRNSACYGHMLVDAHPIEGMPPVDFDTEGDYAPLDSLESIRSSAMDQEADYWGVAQMSLQASLPSMVPEDQRVIFILMGDVEVERAFLPPETLEPGPGSHTPWQTFFFRTGVEPSPCIEAQNMLLIQGPQDFPVDITANGAVIRIHSTILMRTVLDEESPSGTSMELNTISGEAIVYPDTPAALVIRAGAVAVAPLSEPQSLGIDGEANDHEVIPHWTDPRELDPEQLLWQFNAVEAVPAEILNYPIDSPTVLIGDPCTVQTDQTAAEVRVGPGFDRAVRDYLPVNQTIPVDGKFVDPQGHIWWKIQPPDFNPAEADRYWIIANEVEEHGSCDMVPDAPPSEYITAPSENIVATPDQSSGEESITFVADRYSITDGECVVFYWIAEGVREVFFQKPAHSRESVPELGSRLECPSITTGFTLTVIRLDGSETSQSITIIVSGGFGYP